MFAFLLVVQALVAAALVTFILMQKSEGGGLGMGGSPSGLMSARGAADFLTRGTAILATMFVALSIVLAVYASTRRVSTVDTSLARAPGSMSAPPIRSGPPAQRDDAPFAGAGANAAAAAAPANSTDVPLAR